MLKDIAEHLGISLDNLYLIGVSGLGSLGTAIAAMAAWGAAKATKASVDELKEARLQSVRPALVAGLGQERELSFLWSRGCDPRFVLGNLAAAPAEPRAPVLILTNVGSGAAINIQLGWRRAERKLLSENRFETVVNFFKRGRFIVEKEDWGLKICDPNRAGYFSRFAGWGGGAVSNHTFEICPANERVEMEFVYDSLFTLIAEIIADQGEFGRELQQRTDEIRLTYSSISGETFGQTYELRYSGSYVQTIMDRRGSRGEDEWNLIESQFNISLRQQEPSATSWQAYIFRFQRRNTQRSSR